MKLTIEEIQEYETEMLKEVSEICERHGITYFLAYGSVLGAIRHGGPIPWDSDADIVVPHNEMDRFIKIIRENLSHKFFLDYYDINDKYPYLFPRVGLRGYSTFWLHLDVFRLVAIAEEYKMHVRFKKWMRIYRNIFLYKKYNEEHVGKFSLKQKLYFAFFKILLFPVPIKCVIDRFNKLCRKYSYKNTRFIININGGYGMKEIMQKSVYGNGKTANYSNVQIKIPEQFDNYLCHFYGDYMKLPPENERRARDVYYIIKSNR